LRLPSLFTFSGVRLRDWRGEEFRVGAREVFQSLRKGGRDSGIEKEWRKRRWVKAIFVFRER
jgi:hypothetical protein